jgi:hypothetical protein
VIGQVDGNAVEPIRDRRTGRASRFVVGPEHEVINEKLRAPLEEIRERGAALVGVESIGLVDSHPRQRLSLPRQFVAASREVFLRIKQLEPRGQPLFMCSNHVLRHRVLLLRAPWSSRGCDRYAFVMR